MRKGLNPGKRFPQIVIALLTSMAASCASPGANVVSEGIVANAPRARGHLLIVGGGPVPREVTRRFVDLAGGSGKSRIAVIPMASALASTGPEKAAELRSLGADAFVIDVQRSGADADSMVRKLDDATGVWLSGGDQNRLTAALHGSAILRAIGARYQAGAVVGGTSAGAAAMSEVMITGDERRPGGARPLTDSTQAYVTIDRDNVVTAAGFGFLRNVIVDQHFLRRRRQNRLISLVLENPATLGVGVDESTALDVTPDGIWEVIGSSAVVIFDARGSAVTPRGYVLGASGVRMHVLPAGSTFDPVRGRVIRLGGAVRQAH